ncbi:hypothetical protein [Streptomyces sirii]|uniref:hypothetical protein n=1 Tax=Streptomyces sirii TaxID=3127701 RepID=UPI003D35CFC1
MNIFDNAGANAGFGCLAFAAIGTVVIVAGFKFKWLRAKSTVLLVGLFVLLITVNSGGILGEIAGALRLGLNAGGEAAVRGCPERRSPHTLPGPPSPPSRQVAPSSACAGSPGTA